MQRIGVLGGTFDPIHYGHLAIAEEVRWALALTSVYVVPAVQQPLKSQRSVAAPQQRLEMVRLACASNPALIPSEVDLQRDPPSFTVDTLAALHDMLGSDMALWFILGGDSLQTFPRWYAPRRILDLARLAIVQRPGTTVNIAEVEAQVPGLAARSDVVTGPMLDIASSSLRQRLASGQPVRYRLPDSVLHYIQSQQLYSHDQVLHDNDR
jgi:nicotinate-nucleotide adenylyltransferase